MDAHALTHRLGGHWTNGRGVAPCPVCQPERRRDQTALSIGTGNGKILLHCFKRGCSFVKIANAVEMPLGEVQNGFEALAKREEAQAEYAAAKLAKARSLWDFASPIGGTAAEKYLRGRGIQIPLPPSLRFMADIYHGPSAKWCSAMVADVQPLSGVHRTFMNKKGFRMPKGAKMMLGPCCGGAVRLCEGAGPLVVAEGIETGLSVAQMLSERDPVVWACLSTSGMKALILPPTLGDMIVASDGDGAGREAAERLATVATATGWTVSMMPAPEGQDWNDVLQSRTPA